MKYSQHVFRPDSQQLIIRNTLTALAGVAVLLSIPGSHPNRVLFWASLALCPALAALFWVVYHFQSNTQITVDEKRLRVNFNAIRLSAISSCHPFPEGIDPRSLPDEGQFHKLRTYKQPLVLVMLDEDDYYVFPADDPEAVCNALCERRPSIRLVSHCDK